MARTTPVNSGYTIINGTATGSNAASVDCWLEYKVLAQDVTHNYSVVRVCLYSAATKSSTTKWGTAEKFGYVGYNNGNKIYRSTTYDFSNSAVNCFGDATFTITHGTDGTKTVTLQGAWSTSHSSYISGGSASGSVTLPTIARATTPTLNPASVAVGTTVTIRTPGASDSFTHTLLYSCGTASGTIASDVASETTWTVPEWVAEEFPNTTTGAVSIICVTFSGSTQVGTKTVTLTVTIPASYVPSIDSVVATDPTGGADTYYGYVQSKSTLKITVSASGAGGSSITSIKVAVNGTSYASTENPATVTTGYLTASGLQTYTVTVTDSRGRTASGAYQVSVLAYVTPTVTALTAVRCLQDGTEDDEGEYIKATFGTSITPLNNHNGCKVTLQHKKTTDETYTAVEYTGYTVAEEYIFPADADYMYHVMVVATDDFGGSSALVTVSTTFTLIDFRTNGKGISFGKASTRDGFDCAMPAFFKSIQTDGGADMDSMHADIVAIKEKLGL